MSSTAKKLILVIGATGAQGLAVIDALLSPTSDGSPSPYSIRALTRDPDGRRARELTAKGVEIAVGRFDDFSKVASALEGAYGAWINTDGFTVGEERELFAGMRIFELAKQTKGLKHYVWSNLDYTFKKGGYNEDYRVGHYDGKGRVAEWLRAQASEESNLVWSCVTTGPYMDMLRFGMFGPWHIREDGTREFHSPVGDGQVHMIALSDLGFWARYTFDNRGAVSGKDLEVASQAVGWRELVETFTRVTGLPAVYVPLSLDDWFNRVDGAERPVAIDNIRAGKTDGVVTWRENFSGFWRGWRDDVLSRDYDWIRRVHPDTQTLEGWMKAHDYKGEKDPSLLKNVEDSKHAMWQKPLKAAAPSSRL